MDNMRLDATGIKFIQNNEGLPTKNGLCVAYNDGYGNWTIGYGHTQGVHEGQTMTIAQANALLPIDINDKYGKCVNMYIKTKMNQNQFDAMVDLCYNIGTSTDLNHPGFPVSQVCILFNKGDIKGASNAFRGWERPSSLKARREREIKLFNTPVSATIKNATPAKNNNNTNSLNDAKKAQAEKIANAKIVAQRNANNLAKANALKSADALKKAKLTKNPALIKQAQDIHNANKAKIVKKPIQAIKSVKVVKSGIGIIGLIAMVVVLKNGYNL